MTVRHLPGPLGDKAHLRAARDLSVGATIQVTAVKSTASTLNASKYTYVK